MNVTKALLVAVAAVALRYETRCAVVDATSVDGYVANEGRDALRVLGQARFVFSFGDSMSHPEIVSIANDLIIPAGQTVRVARARLPFQPAPGEACRFEVKDAVRDGGGRSAASAPSPRP